MEGLNTLNLFHDMTHKIVHANLHACRRGLTNSKTCIPFAGNDQGVLVTHAPAMCGALDYECQEVCVPANSDSYVEVDMAIDTSEYIKKCPTGTRIVTPVIDYPGGPVLMQTGQSATNVTQCRCNVGFYVLPDTKAWVDGCAPCPAGATCVGAEFGPIALPGYGEVTPGTNFFTECRAGDVSCPGGKIVTGATNLITGTFPANVTAYQCANGYQQNSSLCAACDKS